MRVALIEPTPPDVSAFGTRALSAYLKRAGVDVSCYFLPGGVDKHKGGLEQQYRYEHESLEQLIEMTKGADLIGVSFMSNYLGRARQLVKAIKSAREVPVIVGGIHPTVAPKRCLEFADMVCRGEGEEAVLELVTLLGQGQDPYAVQNIWFKKDGAIIENAQRAPIKDLDSLPFLDFGMEKHYIYDSLKRQIEPMSPDLLKRCLPLEPAVEGSFYDNYKRGICFKTMTTRGCPHHCTFCAEDFVKKLYKGHGWLRKRSVPNIIEELTLMRQNLPFVQSVFPFDDTFLVRPLEEIQEFSRLYKEKIGLPLHIQASPTTTTPEKIEALVDAGLVFVEMGIQTTSQTGMCLYNRKTKTETILKAAEIYHKFQGKLHPPCYHVILDNPWETPQDNLETLNTVLALPAPFWLKRASLVLFPGTELYDKAWREGIIKNEEDEWRLIYGKHLHRPYGTYVNFLMYLAGFSRFPRGVIKLLAQKPLVKLLDRKSLAPVYDFLYQAGEKLIVLSKGVRALLSGDFGRITRYFRRVMDKHA